MGRTVTGVFWVLLAMPALALAAPKWPAKAKVEVMTVVSGAGASKEVGHVVTWPAAKGAKRYRVKGKGVAAVTVTDTVHSVTLPNKTAFTVTPIDAKGRKGRPLRGKPKVVLAMLGAVGTGSGGLGAQGIGAGWGPVTGTATGGLPTRRDGQIKVSQPTLKGPHEPTKLWRKLRYWGSQRSTLACFRGAPSMAVEVELTIDANGRVKRRSVSTPIAAAKTGECLTREVLRWRFAKADGPTTTKQTFEFSAPARTRR